MGTERKQLGHEKHELLWGAMVVVGKTKREKKEWGQQVAGSSQRQDPLRATLE